MYLAEGDLETNLLTLLLPQLVRLREVQEERGLLVEIPKNGLRSVERKELGRRRGDEKAKEVEPWRTAAMPFVARTRRDWNRSERAYQGTLSPWVPELPTSRIASQEQEPKLELQ